MRVLLLTLLVCAPAAAQVAIVEDPGRRARALLDSLYEVKQDYFLDTAFGIYAKRQRVGQVEVSVGGTSSYDVLLKSKIRLGATYTTSSETLELAPNFAVRRKTARESVLGGASSGSEEERSFAAGQWVFRKDQRVARLKSTALNHDELPCLLLFARAMNTQLTVRYLLHSVSWDAEGQALQERPLELRVEPSVKFVHRGKERNGAKVHVSRAGVLACVLYVAGKDVLQVEFAGSSLRLVQGSPRQVARDLPKPRGARDYSTPQRTVVEFLLASVRRDREAFDEFCDWESLHKHASERGEALGEVSVEEFRDATVEINVTLSQEDGISEGAIRLLGMTLVQEIKNDTAEVWMSGSDAFRYILERRDDRWWIVDIRER